jgi:hypothetical protein
MDDPAHLAELLERVAAALRQLPANGDWIDAYLSGEILLTDQAAEIVACSAWLCFVASTSRSHAPRALLDEAEIGREPRFWRTPMGGITLKGVGPWGKVPSVICGLLKYTTPPKRNIIARRRWVRCRALKSPGVILFARGALRFNDNGSITVVLRAHRLGRGCSHP